MPEPPASAPSVPTPEPPADPKLQEIRASIKEAHKHLALGDLPGAEEALKRASAMVTDPSLRTRVEFEFATLHAYRRDFKAAARMLVSLARRAEDAPTGEARFWVHNTLIMIRLADGDLAGALVECQEMTAAGRRKWPPRGEAGRETMVTAKDLWHRAYLLRMFADTRASSERDAFLQYAESARRGYEELTRKDPDMSDSLAVLDGYFAALDGDRNRALAAARRVNHEKNEDFEDLYLTALAYEAGGDAATAERIRQRIRVSSAPSVAVPIMKYFLVLDAANARAKKAQFTPRFPNGSRKR